MQPNIPSIKRRLRLLFLLFLFCDFPFLAATARAGQWTDISSTLLVQLTNSGAKFGWPGGLFRRGGQPHQRRCDHQSGWPWPVAQLRFGTELATRGWRRHFRPRRTGWATSADQNAPTRMASFSLDGTAGWTTDGRNWKRFTDLGRNWDYGSVDWGAAEPKTIIAAKHETSPLGEVYVFRTAA